MKMNKGINGLHFGVFKFLNGITDTKTHLKEAAAGENYEYTSMYVEFEKIAYPRAYCELLLCELLK